MGYYTQYTLEHDGDNITGLDELLTDITGYNWKDLDIGDQVTWYDSDEHMRKISKLYPNILFTLGGKGEESGDLWRAYYKAGKLQYEKAKITFDEFDEEKLSWK